MNTPMASPRGWLLAICLLPGGCVQPKAPTAAMGDATPDPRARRADVERRVEEHRVAVDRAQLRIDGEERPFDLADFLDDGLLFDVPGGSLFIERDERGDVSGRVTLRSFEERGEDQRCDGALTPQRVGEDHVLEGVLADPACPASYALYVRFNEPYLQAGSARLTVTGSDVVLRGRVGSQTFLRVREVMEQHPEVTTLVLADAPGSFNDHVNLETGRLIREAGWSTRIPADGLAASGGLDLFLAGVSRTVEPGGRLGVHSWCCDEGRSGAELPQDHPAHVLHSAYAVDMLGAAGLDFYFFCLGAAPHDGIHWMEEEELERFGVVTEDRP